MLRNRLKPASTRSLKRAIIHAPGSESSGKKRTAPSVSLSPRDVLEPVKIPATKAKNHMGRLLKTVMQGNVVLITMHDTPEAAVIPIAEYARLTGAAEARLDAMTLEFDHFLARMQTPMARKAMQAAFDASPEKLASNAVAFARKRA